MAQAKLIKTGLVLHIAVVDCRPTYSMCQAKCPSCLTFEKILTSMFIQVGIQIDQLKCEHQIYNKQNLPKLRKRLQEMEKMMVVEVIENFLNSRLTQNDNFLHLFQNNLDFLYQKRYVQLIFYHVQLLRFVKEILER